MKKNLYFVGVMLGVFAMAFGMTVMLPDDTAAMDPCPFPGFHCVTSVEVCECNNHDVGFRVDCFEGYYCEIEPVHGLIIDCWDCNLLYSYCSACPPPNPPDDKGTGYVPHETPLPDGGPWTQ